MGQVLLAHQRSLRREVAVKVVKPGIDDEAVLGGLLTEAVITGSLEHPGIVPVHVLGCDDGGRPVLVMKRIEGVSWRELARDARHPAWAKLDAADDHVRAHLEFLMAVCNALHFAHERGIVHRDVKPGNVMIGWYGEVYLLDWGIATRMGAPAGEVGLLGTPAYMAPEMVWGDASLVDARTDVYLAGATLHNVLTGRPRNRGENSFEMMLDARSSTPYAYGPDVAPELAAICNKATSRDPADRYPTALALRRAIAKYLHRRESVELSDGADAQLAEIRVMLARGPGEDPRRLHRLMTECRFAFTAALRAWKDNAPARQGLAACLEAMIEHELSRKDRDGAAALLAELSEPRPDLEARLAALDAELHEQRERDARLRTLEQDHDPTVGARLRGALLAGIVASTVTMSIVARRHGSQAVGHRELILMMAVIVGLLGAAIALLHKRLFSTQVGRLFVGGGMVWAAALLGHRIMSARFGTPIPEMLTVETWLTAAILGVAAIARLRGFGWSAALSAAGAIAAAARPDLATPIFMASALLMGAIMLSFAYRLIK
jgi:serine/threonine-protein kinase